MWKFLGQGSNLCCSSDPSHDSDNARSLTDCTTGELQFKNFRKAFFVKDFQKIFSLLSVFAVKIPLDFSQHFHYIHILSSIRLESTSTREACYTKQQPFYYYYYYLPLGLAFFFFSIMVFRRILHLVPCALPRTLFFYSPCIY